MGEVIALHERNPWRSRTTHDIGKVVTFIEQCRDKVPHRIQVEMHWRMTALLPKPRPKMSPAADRLARSLRALQTLKAEEPPTT